MEMKQRALLAASVAGLLAAVGMATSSHAADAQTDDKAPCYGINKCKGMGSCGGKGHSCAGNNECAGQGYLELQKDTCLKIQGGRLTEDPSPQ